MLPKWAGGGGHTWAPEVRAMLSPFHSLAGDRAMSVMTGVRTVCHEPALVKYR